MKTPKMNDSQRRRFIHASIKAQLWDIACLSQTWKVVLFSTLGKKEQRNLFRNAWAAADMADWDATHSV